MSQMSLFIQTTRLVQLPLTVNSEQHHEGACNACRAQKLHRCCWAVSNVFSSVTVSPSKIGVSALKIYLPGSKVAPWTLYSPLIPTPQIAVLAIPRYLSLNVSHPQAKCFRCSEDSLTKPTRDFYRLILCQLRVGKRRRRHP